MNALSKALMKAATTLLALVFCIAPLNALIAQEQDGFDFATLEQGDELIEDSELLTESSLEQPKLSAEGDWLWLDSSVGILDEGVSVIRSSTIDLGLVLAGGLGYVARSTDNGLTWHIVLTFDDDLMVSGERSAEFDEDVPEDENLSHRVRILREYLQDELEKQFGTEYADYLLDQITDGDLELAEDADALEPLSNLKLDMDTDFNSVYEQELIGEEGFSEELELELEMSYADRVDLLVLGGMPEDEAQRISANPKSLWDIVFSGDGLSIYAVTASGIFVSIDRGLTWAKLQIDTGDERVLSFALSQDGQTLIVGLSEGLSISRDAGISWSYLSGGVPGAVFGSYITPSQKGYYALSTYGLFYSQDRGASWQNIRVPTTSVADLRKLAFAKEDDKFIVLSKHDLFYTSNAGSDFLIIDTSQLVDSNWRDVLIINNDFEQLALISDRNAYILMGEHWLQSNNGLLGQGLYSVSPESSSTQHLSLWLATSIGIYQGLPGIASAINAEKLMELQKQWASEPSLDLIIKQAVSYHHLDKLDEKNWKIRQGTSMLLPRVEFSARVEQKKMDREYEYFYRNSPQATKYYRYQRNENDYWRIMAYWDFNFGKLDRNWFTLNTTLKSLNNNRRRLVQRIMNLTKKRQALQIKEISNAKPNLKRKIRDLLAIAEVEAQLHFLTGGFYLNAIQAVKRNSAN
ncbi:MAG: WD40/YVTN/BNR-like repeat-containing protein [Bradymonadia bacterium]